MNLAVTPLMVQTICRGIYRTQLSEDKESQKAG